MITIPSYNTRITYEDSVLQAHLPFPILTYSLNMRTNIALDTLKLLCLQFKNNAITVETVELTTRKGRRHLLFHVLVICFDAFDYVFK